MSVVRVCARLSGRRRARELEVKSNNSLLTVRKPAELDLPKPRAQAWIRLVIEPSGKVFRTTATVCISEKGSTVPRLRTTQKESTFVHRQIHFSRLHR